MDLIKNDIVEGRVVNQGNSGEGVIRFENFPMFVEYALPGEVVRTKVLKVNKTHAFGKINEILEESKDRVNPPCPYYYKCGGCQLMHQKYQGQLDFKTQRVKDCFERIGGLKDVNVLNTIGMKEPYFYRNKVQMPVSEKDGQVHLGFYAGRSHNVVDIDRCIIQHEDANVLIGHLKDYISELSIEIYDENSDIKENQLRHFLIRKAFYTGELMVVPVFTSVNDEIIRKTSEFFEKISDVKITSLIINLNDRVTNTILGSRNILVFGDDFITDMIFDKKFKISPHSFFQVNPEQTRIMYSLVREFGDFKKTDLVFDLYCGAGTISLTVADLVDKVIGVEIVPQAIEDANFNKNLNNIKNAEFYTGKSEDVAKELSDRGLKATTVILDPPRKGADESLLTTITEEIIPNKIIYVSCDPATLARDCRYLTDNGYSITKVQPVDNFPQTAHVETVVLLSRVEE